MSQGAKFVYIRTTDSTAAGRTTVGDTTTAHICDINYSGSINGTDQTIIKQHFKHWHRQALHGALVQRTHYCETCAVGDTGTRGESAISWSPNGKNLAYTAFVPFSPKVCHVIGGNTICDSIACKVFTVPSDSVYGNTIRRITSVPNYRHDYDPMWSPDNKFIFFDRGDSVIIKKGVQGFGGDTSDVSITASSSCVEPDQTEGDIDPALSLNQEWVAFSRCNADGDGGGHSIWKIGITGDSLTAPRRLTNTTAASDFYPTWSPDGEWIYFQRFLSGQLGYRLCRVSADSGAVAEVFTPTDTSTVVVPTFANAYSPDSAIVICGYGKPGDVATTAVDPYAASSLPFNGSYAVRNYTESTFTEKDDEFPVLSPKLSPDGTRLLLGTKQVWAARRNMNRPPVITSFGSQSIADTTVKVSVNAYTFHPSTFVVSTSDPESDDVQCKAYFLTPAMSFSGCTLTVDSESYSPTPHTNNIAIVVSTSSGGADVLLVAVTIQGLNEELRAAPPQRETSDVAEAIRVDRIGPNPASRGVTFETHGPKRFLATLSVYDVTGRLVARVQSPLGSPLRWAGVGSNGGLVENGVYFYRVRSEGIERTGSAVLLR